MVDLLQVVVERAQCVVADLRDGWRPVARDVDHHAASAGGLDLLNEVLSVLSRHRRLLWCREPAGGDAGVPCFERTKKSTGVGRTPSRRTGTGPPVPTGGPAHQSRSERRGRAEIVPIAPDGSRCRRHLGVELPESDFSSGPRVMRAGSVCIPGHPVCRAARCVLRRRPVRLFRLAALVVADHPPSAARSSGGQRSRDGPAGGRGWRDGGER